MKKSKTQDSKLTAKKPIKQLEPKQPKINLKIHVFRRLTRKHNSNHKTYNNKVLDSLIFNKTTHLSVSFKDRVILEFMDEFLKR